MARDNYGKTRGEINKLKYIRNYERNKFYNGYGKTYKALHFQLMPDVYEKFNELCKRLNISKRDLVLKEFEVFKNE